MIEKLLANREFDFVNKRDKAFIVAFDKEINKLGYTCGNTIGEGYCWGKNMIIYTKAGVKSKKSYARVYLRDKDIVLRFYFSNVEKYHEVIEKTSAFIQEAFIGDYPACDHCHDKTECVHQKHYTINGKQYEICDGKAFWFFEPNESQLAEYMNLFLTFYPSKKRK